MAQSRNDVLDSAIEVLRQGDSLTLDAVAAQAGLTKPGVVYHFKTKDILTAAVVDRVMDFWEEDLVGLAGDDPTPSQRLNAYLRYALLSDFDPSDLAFLADTRLRDVMIDQWKRRLDPWFGTDLGASPTERAAAKVARLIADGAWFDRSLGIVELTLEEREAVLASALDLISFSNA